MNSDRITVQRLTHDELAGREWVFWYFDDYNVLIIDQYRVIERKSKRHKFVASEAYARLGRSYDYTVKEEDVPLPPDVAKEALDQYVARMRVTRWSDRFPPRKK